MLMEKLFQRLEKKILSRYNDWLNRRIPPQREVTLVQNNIFIYPNVQFIYFFVVVMALWIAATNYENNLAFALCFLLLSIFVVCIHHTYNNLAGLKLTVIGSAPVFRDDYTEVEILLSSPKGRMRDALRLGWSQKHLVTTALIDTIQIRLKVPVQATRRGYFNPGRLTVDTVYPIGIIRAVSYIDLDVQILVYPKPVCHGPWQSGAGDGSEGDALTIRRGSEEFSHLQEYQAGDPLKLVAWKQLARERGMLVKTYGDYISQRLWLDWEQFPGLATEERLSTLCYWALQLDKKNEYYGLRLPGTIIESGSGPAHLQKVLTTLALFGTSS
jgi:uncharacterized protein (DUF58 family)